MAVAAFLFVWEGSYDKVTILDGGLFLLAHKISRRHIYEQNSE